MRVLLVDDDPDIRMIAALALGHVGKWEVVTAESGADALDKAQQKLPDLILLDLMMPGMDGLSTLAQIRQRDVIAHVPVIFMTAKVQARDRERYLEAGAIGCIRKPFDPLLLADEVRQMLESARRASPPGVEAEGPAPGPGGRR